MSDTSIIRRPWLLSGLRGGRPPSLDIKFLAAPLDPRITFTRANTATYFDSSGVMQTAAINAPRFDYDPATHALRGLLIEEARTNTTLSSGNLGAAPWAPAATGAAPVVTANNATAPDGTLTAARIVMPAVPAGANASFVSQGPGTTAVLTAFSMWLRGAVGGEIVNLCTTNFAAYAHTTAVLTTAWQRFSFTATPAATGWAFFVGTDMRDATQTPTAAQTFYAWGAQSEAGAFPTSYIPTTGGAVTRAQDTCVIPPANMSWYTPPGGSWSAEFIDFNPAPANSRIIAQANSNGPVTPGFLNGLLVGQYDSAAAVNVVNSITVNAVAKLASTWASGTAKVCANGGAVASSAALTVGYGGTFVTAGVGLMGIGSPTIADNTSGYLRRARYWPRVLSDAEMQQVTR